MKIFERIKPRRTTHGYRVDPRWGDWRGVAVLDDPGQLDGPLDYPPRTDEEEAMLPKFALRSHLARIAFDVEALGD